MTPEVLLALTGDLIVAVKAKNKYDSRDLIKIAQMISGQLPYHEDWDLNKDGVIDETDLSLMQEILLG